MSLGLDLRGGSHLVLEVDEADLTKERLQSLLQDARRVLREKGIQPKAVVRSQNQIVVTLADAAQSDAAVTELKTLANPISTGLSAGQADLAVTANGATITVGFSPAGISANVDNAVQQSLEVIRQRVDQVGVSEPTIQRIGANRVLVQLPGAQDPSRLRELLGSTAKMSFHMTVDEEQAALGGKLFAPPEAITNLHDLKVMLPQFSMPGQPRVNYRELPFVHRFYTPPDPDGSVFVLLHGSGGNETTLMPLLNKAAPRATLLGVRGRATEEGFPRWYKRITPFSFDQNDIKTEAEAFAAFIEGAVKSYGLDPQKVVYVGYSNGANLLNSLLYLHPHLVHKAVLLRSMPGSAVKEGRLAPGISIPLLRHWMRISSGSDVHSPEATDALPSGLKRSGGGVTFRKLPSLR